ncbi:MAG: hypothetical protein ABSG46_20695 [Candidatus Binataceae bacterium]
MSTFMAFYLPRAEAVSLSNIVGSIYGYEICNGEYALCAAAICTPTDRTIEVNSADGPVSFPSATCTCPVYTGPAIADVNGGNMRGSCAPPGPGQIWSLYYPKSNMPQQINDWSHKPADTTAPFQLCSSDDNVGDTFTNCFSFACTLDRQRQNGVKTATCTCPLGENPDGSAVSAATAVITPAGQCDPSVCSDHPVGAAFPGLNSDANACLGTPAALRSNAQLRLSPID